MGNGSASVCGLDPRMSMVKNKSKGSLLGDALVQYARTGTGVLVGIGRLVVAALGELVITVTGGLVIAVLGAGRQGGGGSGHRGAGGSF